MTLTTPSVRFSRRGVALLVVAVACILLPMSLVGTSVALPSIAEHLDARLPSMQWVINGYDLTFAAFMLAAGSLGDLLGRRRVFRGGMAVFAVALAVSAVAPSVIVLDIARAVAGFGAAGVLTCGVASLATMFDDPVGRAKAFGVFGTSVGCGLAFGPFVCGALTSGLGWRAVFWVPAALGALVLVFSRFIEESRNAEAGRIDWAGTATFTSALFFLILGVLQAPQDGWSNPLIVACFVLAAALLVSFAVVENRAEQPMFDLKLLLQRRYAALCLAILALVFAFTPLLVYLPAYYSAVDGLSGQQSGLLLMMLTLPTLVMPLVSGYAAKWVPVRIQVLTTVVLTGVGVAWLSVIEPGVSNFVVLGPYLIIGIGIGISFGVMDGAAVSSVDPGRAGMAAGMFNTVRLGGEAIGIAVVGTLLASLTGSKLAGRLDGFGTPYTDDPQQLANLANQGDLATPASQVTPASARPAFESLVGSAFTDALHIALWTLAGLCAVAVVVLLVLDRPGSVSQPPESVEAADEVARAEEIAAAEAVASS